MKVGVSVCVIVIVGVTVYVYETVHVGVIVGVQPGFLLKLIVIASTYGDSGIRLS